MAPPPRRLVIVARALPRERDPFWDALRASHLTDVRADPGNLSPLTRAGIALWQLDATRPIPRAHDEAEGEPASADSWTRALEDLEARVARERVPVVAFLGHALFRFALAERPGPAWEAALDEGARSSAASGVTFGGARLVALPGSAHGTTPDRYLAPFRDLARLCGAREGER